jgi:hypothetical protein
MLIFLLGAIFGATAGVFVAACCFVAKRADESAAQDLELRGYDRMIPPHGGVRDQQER